MAHRRAILLAPLAASIGEFNADAEPLSAEAIHAILVQRIDVGHQSTGSSQLSATRQGRIGCLATGDQIHPTIDLSTARPCLKSAQSLRC
jgi:hypothetical protein